MSESACLCGGYVPGPYGLPEQVLTDADDVFEVLANELGFCESCVKKGIHEAIQTMACRELARRTQN